MDWHRTARFEKKQMTGPAPDPAYDLLMTPHGFTREHNLPRGHTFALLDQFVVDRAFGGRFGTKETWRYLAGTGDFKVWDVALDQYPGEHRPEGVQAGHRGRGESGVPVLQDAGPHPRVGVHGRPRAHCQVEPHVEGGRARQGDQPRAQLHLLPRPARGEAADRPRRADRSGARAPTSPTLYSQDARKTKVDVRDMGLRGYTRKIGLLERYDGKLQCGQCHVEYNCNPGFNPDTGEAITMADKRTNYFPFVDVNNILKAYDGIQFRDFRNQFTGAALWKAQHPDVETYYNSKHEKAGIDCAQCHMPKVKDAKTGKLYTSHWQTNPKNYLKETCLQCHHQWDEKQARYVIESMASHYQGKVRNAEFWLAQLIGKFGQAQLVARARGRAQGRARQAWRCARELGMVDGRQRRVVPQPRPGEGIAGEVGDRVAGGHQDPRRRDQGEAGGGAPTSAAPRAGRAEIAGR